MHLVDGGQQFLKASPGDGERRRRGGELQRLPDDRRRARQRLGLRSDRRSTRPATPAASTPTTRATGTSTTPFEGIYCDTRAAAPGPRPEGRRARRADLRRRARGARDPHVGQPPGQRPPDRAQRDHRTARAASASAWTTEVYGTIVRNNTIFSVRRGQRRARRGISSSAATTSTCHNTVFFSSPQRLPERDRVPLGPSTGLVVQEQPGQPTPSPGAMGPRPPSVATSRRPTPRFFVDAEAGDLHLADCAAAVAGKGELLTDVKDDLDGRRPQQRQRRWRRSVPMSSTYSACWQLRRTRRPLRRRA